MDKILIVVDIQNDFVDGSLGTPEAQSIVDNAVKKINSFSGDIIATLDTHSSKYLETSEGKKLPVEHCIKSTPGWELNRRIAEALDGRNAHIIEKPSFGSLELLEYIAAEYPSDDTEIELIGLCTDICVVSNALLLKARFPERRISVDASCCAGVTPESHDAALLTMKMCQIDITE